MELDLSKTLRGLWTKPLALIKGEAINLIDQQCWLPPLHIPAFPVIPTHVQIDKRIEWQLKIQKTLKMTYSVSVIFAWALSWILGREMHIKLSLQEGVTNTVRLRKAMSPILSKVAPWCANKSLRHKLFFHSNRTITMNSRYFTCGVNI